MERKFKIGDRVRICIHDLTYDGVNLYSKIGTIVDTVEYNTCPSVLRLYHVNLVGIVNRNSSDGNFVFDERALIPQEEMAINYVAAKEADEMWVRILKELHYGVKRRSGRYPWEPSRRIPDIENIIFNNPATIVFWSDGTKTIVKCSDDECFDEEKGLAMAISKKVLGNKGNYYNEFEKWLLTINEE